MLEKIFQFLGIKKDAGNNIDSRLILIVDDNRSDLLLLKRTIEKMGHRVLTADNGKIGFDLAKKERPDLILSDCRMPEMDGVEMCQRIKEDAQTKNIPLVFLTNVDTPANVVECFDMGVENYICKPINPQTVTNQIKTIFDEHFSSGA